MPALKPIHGLIAAIMPYGLMMAMPHPANQPVSSFRGSVAPLFKAQCVSCHQPGNAQGGLDLATVEGIRKGGVSGPLVKKGDAKGSLLVLRMNGELGKPRMPMGFAPVAPAEMRKVEAWIVAGALLPDPEIRFDRDIAPLFKANCTTCHSGASATGGLDLSSAAGIARGGASGALFSFAKPRESLLLQRLHGDGGKQRMPMGFAPLNAESIAKIERWIAGGAETTDDGEHQHWAFVAPTRPTVPSTKLTGWVRNPIDAFVLQKLESKGWKPAAKAAKETLVRRLYLDLLGLPPTLQELDAFLADTRSDAYERLVDRLLASPHYGENLARKWLDLARYADTDGYEKDLKRTAWLYRDWVIDAVNRDMPYDQFVVEQVAGDLMRDATIPQRVATGFSRNTMQNLEGGVDQAEAHFTKLIDRVSTTTTVFNGLSLGCAQCHDHKFDPLSAQDFYKFMAFFSNTRIVKRGDARVSEEKWVEPEIPVPSREQSESLAKLTAALARFDSALAEVANDESAYQRWREEVENPGWQTAELATKSPGLQGGKEWRLQGPTPDHAVYEFSGQSAQAITGFRVTVLPDAAHPNGGAGLADSGNFVLSEVSVQVYNQVAAIGELAASFVQSGFKVQDLLDNKPDTGWAVSPHVRMQHHLIIELKDPIAAQATYKLRLHMQSIQWPKHLIGKLKIETVTKAFPAQFVVPHGLTGSQDDAAWRKQYATVAPEARILMAERRTHAQEVAKIEREIPTAMVLEENRQGITRIEFRERGEFLQRGAWMDANTPSILPPMKEGLPKNRLGLARWLTDPRHPLTARVQANRLWEHIFGRGIVESSENFGTQGTPPSHPELLDWLATELVRTGWSKKQLLRLIVTSSTYRQSSTMTKKQRDLDPANEWLARAPRYRLDAEGLRDNALRISGLLQPKVGGPSVFPAQPDGIWNTPFSGERWETSEGGERHRRGMYTFLKRTAPYPSFLTFDATSREQCTVRRTRTNTPLQALAMLNDPVFLEAARGLAAEMAKAGPDPIARVVAGFRRCTARRPTAVERDRLVALFKKVRVQYEADASNAKKVAQTPDEAAWIMVANVLLNLDETLNKE